AAGRTPAELVEASIPAGGDQPIERQVTLSGEAEVAVLKGETSVMAWRFTVEPDHAPRIAFARPPSPTVSGALTLAYTLGDDYGVVSGTAEIAPTPDVATTGAARPLVEAPSIPLSLPSARTREGTGETIRDLTAHPWAGAKVRMTLVARDEASQEGRSEPVEVV